MNFHDLQIFPAIGELAAQMLRETGKEPFAYVERFKQGASKMYRWTFAEEARNKERYAAAVELCTAGYADVIGGQYGNFVLRLTDKGGKLSQYLSS